MYILYIGSCKTVYNSIHRMWINSSNKQSQKALLSRSSDGPVDEWMILLIKHGHLENRPFHCYMMFPIIDTIHLLQGLFHIYP